MNPPSISIFGLSPSEKLQLVDGYEELLTG